jgi:hypothetical protein
MRCSCPSPDQSRIARRSRPLPTSWPVLYVLVCLLAYISIIKAINMWWLLTRHRSCPLGGTSAVSIRRCVRSSGRCGQIDCTAGGRRGCRHRELQRWLCIRLAICLECMLICISSLLYIFSVLMSLHIWYWAQILHFISTGRNYENSDRIPYLSSLWD